MRNRMHAQLRHAMALGTVLMTATLAAQDRPPAQPPVRQTPSFRTGVEMVSLNVIVTNADGKYVTDLNQEEFSVFEDGVQQSVTYFTRVNLPIELVLLIDTSASMENKLVTAQTAAVGFARRLRSQDRAAVIDFDSRVDILQPFTADAGAVEAAIRRTSPGGSTSMYNALYVALTELKKNRGPSTEELRRQAIIMLSDGEDTSSLISFDEVLEFAKRSEVSIYAIGLRSKELYPTKGFREAEFVLRQLGQETGGRSFFPNRPEDLADVYGRISEELSSQYTLAYGSKNLRRDGGWRRVVVRVTRPNSTTRTKQGYYAPSTQ